jgi:hypothetical protein
VSRNSLTPAQRTLSGRVGAHESWARTSDRSARTAPARAAAFSRFEREVDPEGVLDPAERHRRAKHAQSAYFSRLALRSSRSRSRAAAARKAAAELDRDAADADAELAVVETEQSGGDAA